MGTADFAPIDWLVEQSMLHQASQIAARYSDDEQDAMFSGTASRVYRL